jgi:hypothetical protein
MSPTTRKVTGPVVALRTATRREAGVNAGLSTPCGDMRA